MIAAVVDMARLAVYANQFFAAELTENRALLGAAALAACVGALVGNRLVEKITLRSIEVGVAILLVFVALGLGAGIL